MQEYVRGAMLNACGHAASRVRSSYQYHAVVRHVAGAGRGGSIPANLLAPWPWTSFS
jgi:hypothetical protein